MSVSGKQSVNGKTVCKYLLQAQTQTQTQPLLSRSLRLGKRKC